jgi:hypothetical protein
MPPTAGTARVLAVVEVMVALAALLIAARPGAVLLAAWYLALAGVSALLLRWGDASCGCFGSGSAPPHAVHVLANAGLAVAGGAAAIADSPAPISALLDGGPGGGVVAVEAIVGAALVVALYRDLPRVLTRPGREMAELGLSVQSRQT